MAWRRQALTGITCLLGAAAMLLLALQLAYRNWWGGWSYGPRLASEAVFLLVVASILTLGSLQPAANTGRRAFSALVIALLAGSAVNLPGMYNPSTQFWNAYPDIDDHAARVVFDWRFPQFRANPEALRTKYETQSRELGLPADAFIPEQRRILALVVQSRETVTTSFHLRGEGPRLYARMAGVSLGVEKLTAYLNDSLVGEYPLRGLSTHFVDLPPALLRYDQENQLRLELHRGRRLNAFVGAMSVRQY